MYAKVEINKNLENSKNFSLSSIYITSKTPRNKNIPEGSKDSFQRVSSLIINQYISRANVAKRAKARKVKIITWKLSFSTISVMSMMPMCMMLDNRIYFDVFDNISCIY